MNKKETIKIITNCVKEYEKQLKDNNIMFIFENKKSKTIEKSINFIETIYYPYNFLHLTGVEYKKENSGAVDFYNNALNGRISEKDINIISPFLVGLKLSILHNLINIDKSVKFIGDYNNITKNKLYTEKVVGNVAYCYGFVKDKNTNYFYFPNTTLKENIKNITNDTCNIIAILKKNRTKDFYSTITYLKNSIDLNSLLRNNDLANLIDFEHLEFANKEDIKNTEKVANFRNELIDIVYNKKEAEEDKIE